jgi:hypothetical protein
MARSTTLLQQLQNSSQQNSEFWILRKNSDERFRILMIFRILVLVQNSGGRVYVSCRSIE